MPLYLIVASKTWTVESLSNETVLITNLTAFWNSDEFPIIFKQRNTHNYKRLEMTLKRLISPCVCVCVCTAYGFATVGKEHKREVAVTSHIPVRSGTDSEPAFYHSLKDPGSKWHNCVNEHPTEPSGLWPCLPPSTELTFICKA